MLTGPAAQIHDIITRRLAKADPRKDTLKFLFTGPPGNGKSTLCLLAAWHLLTGGQPAPSLDRRVLARHPHWSMVVQTASGTDVDVDVVRQWNSSRGQFSMFGDWNIRIIEELDAVPNVAQTAMLAHLDNLPPGTAILASSNADTDLFQSRFQSRFQVWQVKPVPAEDVARYIIQNMNIPANTAHHIATLSNGDLRAAINDAQSYLDAQ